MALLEVNHLNISFGGLHAVDDFHVSIEKGQEICVMRRKAPCLSDSE